MATCVFPYVFVSKGFDNKEAVEYRQSQSKGTLVASFRIGEKVYDPKVENNARYNNYSMVAFGGVAERMQKMGITAKSIVSIVATPDIEKWEDKDGNKRSAMKFIVTSIEYLPLPKLNVGNAMSTETVQKPQEQPTPPPPAYNPADEDLPF